jgi:hypothetical protein
LLLDLALGILARSSRSIVPAIVLRGLNNIIARLLGQFDACMGHVRPHSVAEP